MPACLLRRLAIPLRPIAHQAGESLPQERDFHTQLDPPPCQVARIKHLKLE